MKKQELILEVMNLFEDKEQLEREVKDLKSKMDIPLINNEGNQMNRIDQTIFEIGRKALFESIVYSYSSYKSITVSRDDETEEIVVQTYSDWFKQVVQKEKIPNHLSLKETLDYFEGDFKSLYEEQKKIALEDLKIEEQ